jgi:AcrR family transcriptional regulator
MEDTMNGPEKRVEQPNPVDERILAAAQAEFRQRGFYKANLDDVAGRLGLGKGTIYRHFKNKSVLFAAVVFHMMKLASERISESLEKKSFDDKLDSYLEILTVIAGEGAFMKEMAPEAAREVFLREKAFPKEGTALLDRMMILRKDLIRVLTVILNQGISEKRISEDCDPVLTAEFVASLAHSFCANRMQKDAILTPTEMRCLNQFIRRALGCVPAERIKQDKENP